MSDEIESETAKDGDKLDTTEEKNDNDTKEPKAKDKSRSVSFNSDVHVKRFGKPRESRSASTEPTTRKEPFTHLSEQELIDEANKVRAQASSVTCTADHPPEKFFSLPHRKKLREDRDRRNSDDATDKKPLGRSTSDVSSKRKERTSLSTLFRRAQKSKPPASTPVVVTTKPIVTVKRSKSDVSDLKSNTNLNPQIKPIRKRSGSESEEFLKSLRNKKAQLSPIIESSPRDDYFKKTPPLDIFLKKKLVQKDSVQSEEQNIPVENKVNPIEKPPRYKSPERSEPKPPVRTKRGKSAEKELESSAPITETPKRKTDIKKTLLVDEIDTVKTKDINVTDVKDRIKDSIRKIKENIYGGRDMIHSSQKPPDKPPLTRGNTVDHMVRILKEDQRSPPPKSHLISPTNNNNINQPFSYTKPSVSPDPNLFARNTSPERVPSPVNKMNGKGVVYAHIIRDHENGSSNLGKQTVHKTYSPPKEKYGNVSDEDEGLGYEDRYKYSTNRCNFKNKENNFDSLDGPKITDSPIRPRFIEYKLTNFNDFEPTYANEYPSPINKSHDFIDTYRGRGDGMDTKKMNDHDEIDNRLDLEFNELSHRRQMLESRLNARKTDRERTGGTVTRYLTETDPIYEAEKRMKATEKYVHETAKYMSNSLDRDGFAEKEITEDYDRYDTDNYHKVKYNTETRSFQKVQKGDMDRRQFIDSLEPRYKDEKKDFPPEPEYEPPSLEFKAKPIHSPDEYKEKKYKAKKHFTSSHDVLTGQKYKGRDDYFGKRKGHYASNPEIAQEREEDYANIRNDAKQAESYHNSLRRVKNKEQKYGVQRHDSGDSRDYYRENRSPRQFDFDSRLVDSGIENDFRKGSSGEIHRRRLIESDDDVRDTSLFLASERRHTEDNYPSEQLYANGEYLARFKDYRNDEYRKGYGRERSADDGSQFDPKKYEKSPSRPDDKVSAKPPKVKKLSGLEKVKQLFSRDSSKKSKKEKELVQQKTRTRVLKSPEHLAEDDSEYKRYTDPEPSDIDTKKKEDDRRYIPERHRSSRESIDRQRSSEEESTRHRDNKYKRETSRDLPRRTDSREKIDRHGSRDKIDRQFGSKDRIDRQLGSRNRLDRQLGSRDRIDRPTGSRDGLDKYRSSKEDLRYRSPDPRDSEVERKYRETNHLSRYERTLTQDRRTDRREEKRRYTSSDRESDVQRSDADSDLRKTRSRTEGPLDSPALAERYRSRRRLATPSPTPSPPRRPPPATTGNWFKSLDRLTRKKKKDVKVEKESVPTTEEDPRRYPKSKPLNSPAKNLRFFGDTDVDSDSNIKPKPNLPRHSTLRKTVSNSSKELDETDEVRIPISLKEREASPSRYYKRNLQNISEVHSNSETESQFERRAMKPPISPYERRSRSQSSSKTLKGKADVRRRNDERERGSSSELRSSRQELNRDLKHRRRTPATNSGESSTEGESSHQSQRSVVFLHATTVGDIPDPGHLSRNRSRDDVSSVNSSNLQVRSTTKSFSIFAPWTPKLYPEHRDVNYTSRPRRSKPKEIYKPSSNLETDRSNLQKNKSYSQTTLTRKPQSNRLSNSSTTLYRKPRDQTSTLRNNYRESSTLRKDNYRDKKSQSNEVLHRNGRDGISRSISMPKDDSKKAGWFKLPNKKKQEPSRVR